MWNLVCTCTLCTVSHHQGCSFRLHCWKYVCLRKKLREAEVEGCTRAKHSLNNQGLVGDIDDLTSKEETRDYPVKLVYKRPHIVLNSDKEIVGVIWSPAFEGPLLVPEKSLKMAPGDLVCFNNRRILHGRKSFNLNGGVRHLKGCYVNIDEFRNTFQVMSELISSGEPCKRVGNQCFL